MKTTTRQGSTSPSNQDFDNHPNPIDRNRSILWARYLADSKNWIVVSTKETTISPDDNSPESTILSVCVMDADGKVVYEALVKPEGIVSNEAIAVHDLETSTLFNAQPYSVIRQTLVKLISGNDVLSWDFDTQRTVFEKLDRKHNMPPHEWRGNSVSHQYARFLGQKESEKPGYVMPELQTEGESARASNKAVCSIVMEMAGSSQFSDPLASGKPGWTAEFYRPKLTAGEKLKNLFNRK